MIRFEKVQAPTEAALAEKPLLPVFTNGMIEKLDARGGRITISHEAIENLDLAAAVTIFRFSNAVMAKDSALGQVIRFAAEKISGKLTVTGIE